MADIKYVQVPIRVKPHTDYLDMKGVEELWVKIKEYVNENGGKGSVNEEEVNKLIADYYKEHADELKGDPFTFADFTDEQLADLKIKGDKGDKGEKGDPFTYEDFTEDQLLALKGEKGDKGNDGTVTFESLTDEQKLTLKGEKGDKGDAFTYADFTEEQLASLKGEKGDKGADGTMVFEDLTEEQRASLKGDKGDKGDQGEVGRAFTYEDFTAEQLEALKVKGDKGDKGDQGIQGIQGIQGVQGVPGADGQVDYSLVYKKSETYSKTEIDDKLKDIDVDVDLSDINLDNYYDKTEIDGKFNALEIEGSTGVHVGDSEPENPLVSIWVDTDGIPYNGDVDLAETFYTKDEVNAIVDNKKYNLSEMVNDIGFLTEATVPTRTSQLTNDSGFLTTEDTYTKGSLYTKDEVNALLSGYEPDTDLDLHEHSNLQFLEKLGESDGELTYNGVKVATGEIPEIDLTGYATEAMLNAGLAGKADIDHTHEYATETIYDVVVANGGAIKGTTTGLVDTPFADALANGVQTNGKVLKRTDKSYADMSVYMDNYDYYIYASDGIEKLTATDLDNAHYLIVGDATKLYLMKCDSPGYQSSGRYVTETENQVTFTELPANKEITLLANLSQTYGYIYYSDTGVYSIYSDTTGMSKTVLNAMFTIEAEGEVPVNYTKEEWSVKVDELVTNGIPTVDGESIDLSGYALKSDIPDVSNFITSIPSEYVTESELNAKGYLTQHIDISGKADVDHTHSEYLTEHQSLVGYATETYVNNAIANLDVSGGSSDGSDQFVINVVTSTYDESNSSFNQYRLTVDATDEDIINAYQSGKEIVIKDAITYGGETFLINVSTISVSGDSFSLTGTIITNGCYCNLMAGSGSSWLLVENYLAMSTDLDAIYGSGYQTKSQVEALIDTAIADIDTSGGGVGQTYSGSTYGEIFNDYSSNKASGMYSHAEGYNTTVSADFAHAEGYFTTASAMRSHAEGQSTKAQGVASHAEGTSCIAKGHSSHAEGSSTTASGQNSHAEGWETKASGGHSHAEGQGTIASGQVQHAQGSFNIEDDTGNLLHIVGNGMSASSRSNAHTLDWDGNAWFAGKVYVGGTSMADATELGSGGSVDLSNYYTKTETDALIPEATDLSGYYTKTETDAAINTAVSAVGGSSETWETIYENTFNSITTTNIDTELKAQVFNLEDYSKVKIVATYKSTDSSSSNQYVPGLRLYKSTDESYHKMNCYNTNAKMTGSGGLYGDGNYATLVGTINNYDDYYDVRIVYSGYDEQSSSSANTKNYSADVVATKLYGFDKFQFVCLESTPSATMNMTIKFLGIRK